MDVMTECEYLRTLQYACPEVEYFWRVKQVMKISSHTLRVQILDREGEWSLLTVPEWMVATCVMTVRQLEQQVKSILDSIAIDDARKRELIRGDAVDKAEQLSKSADTASFFEV